ncbi:MAG TPA: hypothetical protein VEB21_10510 [Terriglobales bacterium]|nr:hypothetical protein [Terriglobales bacterium]
MTVLVLALVVAAVLHSGVTAGDAEPAVGGGAFAAEPLVLSEDEAEEGLRARAAEEAVRLKARSSAELSGAPGPADLLDAEAEVEAALNNLPPAVRNEVLDARPEAPEEIEE